jgi:hypothetical protein
LVVLVTGEQSSPTGATASGRSTQTDRAVRPRGWKGLVVLNATLAVVWTARGVEESISGAMGWSALLYLLVGVGSAVAALNLGRHRLELGPEGLRVGRLIGSRWVAWAEVVEVRGNAGAWSEYPVLDLTGGRTLKLAGYDRQLQAELRHRAEQARTGDPRHPAIGAGD